MNTPTTTHARLIEDSARPGAFRRMSALMQTLSQDVRREVYRRLTDVTPNPTGDR